MAGAVFGEVGVLLFVAGAAFREILIDSRSAKCCIFQYKNASPRWDEEGLRGGGCEMTISWSDCRRIVFLLAEAIHGVSAEILNLQISWPAQYLVRLEGDFACSAHCK